MQIAAKQQPDHKRNAALRQSGNRENLEWRQGRTRQPRTENTTTTRAGHTKKRIEFTKDHNELLSLYHLIESR